MMATYTGITTAKHATLSAATVDTVTFTTAAVSEATKWRTVEILNRSTSEVYVTFGSGTPTVAGDNTYVVPAGTSLSLPMDELSVKLISSGSAAYSVTRLA